LFTKVPEESQLIYRAPAASLECSCFISDSEFLSGSDDGSLELWSVMRKKPTHIVKNAHPMVPYTIDQNIPIENGKEVTQGNFQQFCWQIIYIIFS
jgi:ribosomal RNA-processing protein 9